MPAIESIAEIKIKRPVKKILPNGIVLNILDLGKEEVVRMDIVTGSGQLDQKFPLQAMMTNRMLREGTRSMASAVIAEKLDFYGAWLDLSSSVRNGFITLYSLNKFFGQTIEVLEDMVKNPVFPERELKVVTESNKQVYMVNRQRVEVMARKRLNKELFGENHPLGRFAEMQDYENLNRDMLEEFYLENYYAENCTIFVAGRVTEEVLKKIEECFGTGKWGRNRCKSITDMPQPEGKKRKRVNVEKKDALQSSVKIGCFMPDCMHKDFMDAKVMNTILGGYFGSRLMKNIREDKGYTYGIGSGIVIYPERSVLIISTETANEYVEDVVKEVKMEIDRLKNTEPDEEEMVMVRNYMMGDICRAYENSLSVSEAWIYVNTAGVDEDFFDRSVDSIKNISGKRIMELANKYLDWENMVEVVAGNV